MSFKVYFVPTFFMTLMSSLTAWKSLYWIGPTQHLMYSEPLVPIAILYQIRLCKRKKIYVNKPIWALYKNCLIYFDAAVRNAPSSGLFFSIT